MMNNLIHITANTHCFYTRYLTLLFSWLFSISTNRTEHNTTKFFSEYFCQCCHLRNFGKSSRKPLKNTEYDVKNHENYFYQSKIPQVISGKIITPACELSVLLFTLSHSQSLNFFSFKIANSLFYCNVFPVIDSTDLWKWHIIAGPLLIRGCYEKQFTKVRF